MEMEMEMATPTPTPTPTDLVMALEKAALMAKQIPSTATATATATDSANISAALHAVHQQLSLFLAHSAQPSADATDGDDAPMEVADEEQQMVDGETEEDSKMASINSVEERMRNCFVRTNKRLKRPLSPKTLAAGEQRGWLEYESESAARAGSDFDPHVTKLRALDLIYQFHC